MSKPVRVRDDFISDLELIGFVTEYRFMEGRRFAWDAALPDFKIAVEYSGIMQGIGGHSSVSGLMRDAEKFTEGAILGWLIVICHAESCRTGKAWDQVVRAIEARGGAIQ